MSLKDPNINLQEAACDKRVFSGSDITSVYPLPKRSTDYPMSIDVIGKFVEHRNQAPFQRFRTHENVE
jgi:hypothetical protein